MKTGSCIGVFFLNLIALQNVFTMDVVVNFVNETHSNKVTLQQKKGIPRCPASSDFDELLRSLGCGEEDGEDPSEHSSACSFDENDLFELDDDFDSVKMRHCRAALVRALETGQIGNLFKKLSSLSLFCREVVLSELLFDGKTALQIAVEREFEDIVRVVFDVLPLDIRQKVASIGGNNCAIELAYMAGFTGIINLIISATQSNVS